MDARIIDNQQAGDQAGTITMQPDFSQGFIIEIDSKELENRAHLLITRCQHLLEQIKEKTDRIHLLL